MQKEEIYKLPITPPENVGGTISVIGSGEACDGKAFITHPENGDFCAISLASNNWTIGPFRTKEQCNLLSCRARFYGTENQAYFDAEASKAVGDSEEYGHSYKKKDPDYNSSAIVVYESLKRHGKVRIRSAKEFEELLVSWVKK